MDYNPELEDLKWKLEDLKWKQLYELFNTDQKIVFDKIDNALQQNISQTYFLDAVGGTCKTFLFNALLSKWRSKQKNVLAVASSGIAALLLSGSKMRPQDLQFL